jgi:hypothetical protein
MPLPEIPQSVIDVWGITSGDVIFQTKDTPSQAMLRYKIDSAGLLWVQKVDGYWTEKEEVSADASFSEKINAMSHFVVEKKWWEQDYYSGSINFYESFKHPEQTHDTYYGRFEYGWVEYRGLFKNGALLGDIELVEIKQPVKLTDEELKEKQKKARTVKREIQSWLKKDRKENPTPPQKLVDDIDRELKLVETIMDESDIIHALNNIKTLIKTYRKKYDQWY